MTVFAVFKVLWLVFALFDVRITAPVDRIVRMFYYYLLNVRRSDYSLPPAWIRKQRMSLVTKVAVSHLCLMKDRWNPSTRTIMRPNTMYIDAANQTGAIKINSMLRMSGVSPVNVFGYAVKMRFMKPIHSTASLIR